ncbi:Mg2+ transporter protein, CorA-like/Zinc transport protein ZntB, partial [Pseudohyphozyma bogoriensis]
LKGEERAMRAEERRLGKGKGEEGPAWWLDVMCPSVADMRELRKILPLHPLTMEDILHQETREKIEPFTALGYYFIVFRALDESYFQYTSPTSPEASRTGSPVAGKDGVEGVGVGAVNVYLVVFGDGIISFHFEDISKHSDRVQGKIQQFGLSRAMSSHWIAYGLMDSIVDAFFPLIDFIEGESQEVSTFLADPLQHSSRRSTGTASPSGVGIVAGHRVYDDQVIGIAMDPTGSLDKDKEKTSSGSSSSFIVKQATVSRNTKSHVLKAFPRVLVPPTVVLILPSSWTKLAPSITTQTMLVNEEGLAVNPRTEVIDIPTFEASQFGGAAAGMGEPKFDRSALLARMAEARKLVTGLNRLLGPKQDVVRGLRKRTRDENLRMFGTGEMGRDIGIYIGDLFDHIVTMQQSLNFYDATLSHDHPAFVGILKLSLSAAKAGTDTALVKLYIVSLTFLPINILTGLFSGNNAVPRNGDRTNHLLADGSLAGYGVFGMVIGGVFFIAIVMWTLIWLIFRSSRRQAKKRGGPL